MYARVVEQIDLADALARVSANDLLPPRPDDKIGGAVGERFVRAIEYSLTSGRYEPEPAVSVPVTKPKFSTRPAALMNLIDRVVYESLVEPLRSRIERGLVSKRVLYWPRGDDSPKAWPEFQLQSGIPGEYVVRADVTGFYESIDHDVLQFVLIKLTGRVELVELLIDFLGQVMGGPRGLPQGIATSDVLATAYLSVVDAEMLRYGFAYRRHGDDVRISVPSYDEGRRAVHALEGQFRSVRLLLNAEKTLILHRSTYDEQLTSVDSTRQQIQGRILRERKAALQDASDEEIENLVEAANLDVRVLWDVFYHRNMTLEELADQLAEHLKPDQVAVAVGAFEEAISRAPGSGADALSNEDFHGLVSTSIITLLAKKLPNAIPFAAKLIANFPDKTELVSKYLSGVAAAFPQRVEAAAVEGLTSGYLTGWQKAWLMVVLRRVASATVVTNFGRALAVVEAEASGEEASWLGRAEAVRLLAEIGRLDHQLLIRVWNRAPVAIRADLASAAAVVARKEGEAWAEAFCDSLKADPLMDVVLHRIDNETNKAV